MNEIVYSLYDGIDWDIANKTIICIDGWNELNIEYVILEPSYLVWKIKGTSKIFSIDYNFVMKKHSKIEEHFELLLKALREDILDWKQEGFKEPWMKIYKDEIFKYING